MKVNSLTTECHKQLSTSIVLACVYLVVSTNEAIKRYLFAHCCIGNYKSNALICHEEMA